MNKTITLMLCILFLSFNISAQTNLITNPGFEDSPATFTVPVGTPIVNHLFKVASNAATVTGTTQPTATSISVADGLWVKRQTVTSSSLQAYLASGGANGSATFLFLKIAGGNNTAGFDWTKMSAQQRVLLSNSTVYTYSFWAKVGSKVTTAYAYIADKTGDTGSAAFVKTIPLTGGTTWTKYTVSFDIPAERALKPALDYTTAFVGIGINALYTTAATPLTENNWLYVDDFELKVKTESLVPTITSNTPENVFIKTTPIPVNIKFNGDVTGFTVADLLVTNGTLNNFTQINSSTYTVSIVPTTTGKVTLDIAAGAAEDTNARISVAANQFLRLFNNETTTGDYTNFTTICPAKDNKKAVYTFTADDGFTDAATFFNNEFKRLDLVGSLALVANWINGAQTPASTYSFWNTLLADGRIDIINHSKTHVKFSSITNTPIGQDSLYNEIIGNQNVFKSKLPGQQIITMANPSVVNTTAADVLIKQSHYAARNGGSGYNTLSPTDTEWYKLNMLANYFGSQSRAAYSKEINKYVDNTITNKQWLIILAHGIGTGANAMQDTAFTKHFEYVATKRADLWIGTFGDVTRYFREKQNAFVLTLDSTSNRIAISVTHNLDATIFNFPLTLKTKVPSNWTNITVTQAAVVKYLTSVVEDNESYVYYDAVPNGGSIILAPTSPNGLSLLNQNAVANTVVFYQPTTASLIVKNGADETITLKIYNFAGKVCDSYSIVGNEANIQLDHLRAGNYLVSCYSSRGTYSSVKFIKE